MFLDLDNFKNVNDSLGHDAGDRLLQAAAQRLVKSTRPSDTVARLGGDEFAILLEGIGSDADVERVATSVSEAFNRPLLLDGREIEATASIGVACSRPGDDAEQLLRNADIAMYGAKAAGKARLVVFQPHMQEQLHDRLRLEQDIDLGLARDEFFLEFQPVVDLASRELLGVEALLRWNHPQRGVGDARRLHPDRGGIRPDRRARSPGPGRSVHAGPRVQRLDRRPGRACAWRSTSRAATCSRATSSRTCATHSRSPASSPAAS